MPKKAQTDTAKQTTRGFLPLSDSVPDAVLCRTHAHFVGDCQIASLFLRKPETFGIGNQCIDSLQGTLKLLDSKELRLTSRYSIHQHRPSVVVLRYAKLQFGDGLIQLLA